MNDQKQESPAEILERSKTAKPYEDGEISLDGNCDRARIVATLDRKYAEVMKLKSKDKSKSPT
ncbi:MAG: hypothetical protein RR087_03345 [Oscillospiraceae bacterium]